MSLRETQNFLARLYTDAGLRRAFLAEPEKIGLANDLTESEIGELARVVPGELDFFSESLFYKRLRGTEKFLPLTRRALDENFEPYFREFADGFLPVTVKKHLEDAVEFTKFIRTKEIKPDWAQDLIKYERARLEFDGWRKPFVFQTFRHDVRVIAAESPNSGGKTLPNLKKRKTFAVWFRTGKRARHFVW